MTIEKLIMRIILIYFLLLTASFGADIVDLEEPSELLRDRLESLNIYYSFWKSYERRVFIVYAETKDQKWASYFRKTKSYEEVIELPINWTTTGWLLKGEFGSEKFTFHKIYFSKKEILKYGRNITEAWNGVVCRSTRNVDGNLTSWSDQSSGETTLLSQNHDMDFDKFYGFNTLRQTNNERFKGGEIFDPEKYLNGEYTIELGVKEDMEVFRILDDSGELETEFFFSVGDDFLKRVTYYKGEFKIDYLIDYHSQIVGGRQLQFPSSVKRFLKFVSKERNNTLISKRDFKVFYGVYSEQDVSNEFGIWGIDGISEEETQVFEKFISEISPE